MNTHPLDQVRAVLLDIDGTLIDSNDAHARAWVDALRAFGIEVPYYQVRSKIGMGGDHLLPAVTGIEEDSAEGEEISNLRGDIFRAEYLPTLSAFAGARELLKEFAARNIEMIVATSASKEDLQSLLKQGGIDDLLTQKTTSDDAENSKPNPDIIEAALEKTNVPREQVRMIGDTPYDILAARRAGVQTIAFTCGGWGPKDLSEAVAIYEGPADMLSQMRVLEHPQALHAEEL